MHSLCVTLEWDFQAQSDFQAQAGQDKHVLKNLLLKCGKGFYVEFGARDGKEHSNTYFFEKQLGWRGMLFEVDPSQLPNLRQNRPAAIVYEGAVCPRAQTELTFGISQFPGWSGAMSTYEPSRSTSMRRTMKVKCFHLADELRAHGIQTVDYMTIDTEGSEADIIEDFPWAEFNIEVVQIEQLHEGGYPAQRGKKARIQRAMARNGYTFVEAYEVARRDTEDLIFTRNVATAANASHPVLNHVRERFGLANLARRSAYVR
jgi:FkbM family methyltransferase